MEGKLSDKEKEIIQQFESGRQLLDTTRTPGWQIVLDIMESMVAKAEFQLMNYDGVERESLVALHRRARTMREFFQTVQTDIAGRIEAAHQLPETVQRQRAYPEYDDESF